MHIDIIDIDAFFYSDSGNCQILFKAVQKYFNV